MKRFACSAIMVAAVASILLVSYASAATIEDFLIKDSTRTWLFSKDSIDFGTLKSTYRGPAEYQGLKSFHIEETLDLDFTKIKAPAKVNLHNNHYVDLQNAYVGDSMSILANGETQGLELVHRGDSLYGSAQNVAHNNVDMPLRATMMTLDNNMVDQMELIFWQNDLKIGDTLTDTFFVAQFLTGAEFEFIVDSMRTEEVNGVADTVLSMRMLTPMQQAISFGRKTGLIKIKAPVQGFAITRIDNESGKSFSISSGTSGGFFTALPLYLFYILVGLVFGICVIKNYYNRLETYIVLILGAAGFSILRYTQIPLQTWYATTYIVPGLKAGGSLFFYSGVQALFSGLIQETLKLIPLILILTTRPPSKKSLVILGMFTGMGFGIMEACSITGFAYQSGLMSFISWATFERIFAILFHTSTGAALGYALAAGWKKVPAIWLLMVLIHSFSNLLIVFYQKEMVALAPLELIVAGIDVVLALLVWLAVRGATRTDGATPQPN